MARRKRQPLLQLSVLYKENGFQKKEDAQKLIEELSMQNPLIPHVLKMELKKGK